MKNARLFSAVMIMVMLVTALGATPALAMGITRQAPTGFGSGLGMPNLYIPEYTASYSQPYSCYLVKQSPEDWVTMKPRQSFDMLWTVINTGHKWDSNYTVIKYLWGAKMQTRGDVFDIDGTGYGKKAHIGIDMVAPKTQGTYPITWGIYSGSNRVCILTFIVTVVK